MKNLLSMLAVSTLVGTSAGNLKPVFTSNVVNHGFQSNQINNKEISITNENNINPFDVIRISNINSSITVSSFAPDGTVWVGTSKNGLWKSTDGINFNQVNGIKSDSSIYQILIISDKTIYLIVNNKLYNSNDGINFQQVTNEIPNDTYINSIAKSPNGTIYFGDSSGVIWKSTDGINFEIMSNDSGIPKTYIKTIAVALNDDIYIGIGDEGAYTGVYKSHNEQKFQIVNDLKFSLIQSIKIAPDGTVWVGTSKNGLWKSTDGINFNQVNGIKSDSSIYQILIISDKTIYLIVNNKLYNSNDGINFQQITNSIPIDEAITSIIYTSNDNFYIGTNNSLILTKPVNSLLKIFKPDTFAKSWPLYKGFAYNFGQKIDIKENLVASATLDGKSITIPTTDLNIPSGEHNLILTLKDKKLASVFGGDVTTGQVTYKLWVKTSINKNDIKYSTNKDDTELYTGLVSNAGNTNGVDIIQTKNKNISVHQATLNSKFDDILIDYPNSYYVEGTVDSSNNFTENGTHQRVSQNFSITTDGIYHLHLEDTVGNQYESYLELGESNWKLKGTFNDDELDKLKAKLNVTVNITDPSQKSKALGWLHQYENFVENKFNETIKTNGKGFDSEIKNQITSYTPFLKTLTYNIANEPKFDDGLDKDLLVKTVTDKAQELLTNGLSGLPQNLNVDSKNVVNKSTLDNYKNWITNYQDFINNNKDQWISDITKITSRGFATEEQENLIKDKIRNLLDNSNIKNYLKDIVWEDNKLLKATSSGYQQYVKLEKLKSDTIDWVNTNMKDINIAYQNAIKNGGSGLNLHGYSIDTLLNGKPKPQTKSEIDNFADGQSYHDWLQSQANIKFRGWQLAMGFDIGILLLLIAVAVGWIIRSRTNPKYNGVARARKDLRQERKQMKKKWIN